MSKIKSVKGFKDVFAGAKFYRHTLDRSLGVLEGQFGYQQLLLNMLERKETFSHTLGLSSDIVQKEMYNFTDLGGNELVLRPEGTAGAMRFLLADKALVRTIEKEPVRMWYWGPMFRYERPQAGRLRQFYQLGIENIGGTPLRDGEPADLGHVVASDFEVISAACECLDMVFNHKVNFQIQINNLGTKQSLKDFNEELLKQLKEHRSKLSADS